MNYDYKQIIFVLACFAFIGAAMLYAVSIAVTHPDVYFSYSTQECVKVVNYGTNYTCENLPSRYYHVWVE